MPVVREGNICKANKVKMDNFVSLQTNHAEHFYSFSAQIIIEPTPPEPSYEPTVHKLTYSVPKFSVTAHVAKLVKIVFS